MQITFDTTEEKNINEILKTIQAVTDLGGKEYNHYFKVIPGPVGYAVLICCDGLYIEKDVTNYSNW